jgi:hypothetical protein
MGFRFRKSIRILPGLRLNLSKSGVGLGFGGSPLSFSVGPKGKRATASIPGTGLSFSTAIPDGVPVGRTAAAVTPSGRTKLATALLVAAGIAVLLFYNRPVPPTGQDAPTTLESAQPAAEVLLPDAPPIYVDHPLPPRRPAKW